MKPKDPDTFIDIGASITRLLLIASGQGTAASLIGEGAGLLRNLKRLGVLCFVAANWFDMSRLLQVIFCHSE